MLTKLFPSRLFNQKLPETRFEKLTEPSELAMADLVFPFPLLHTTSKSLFLSLKTTKPEIWLFLSMSICPYSSQNAYRYYKRSGYWNGIVLYLRKKILNSNYYKTLKKQNKTCLISLEAVSLIMSLKYKYSPLWPETWGGSIGEGKGFFENTNSWEGSYVQTLIPLIIDKYAPKLLLAEKLGTFFAALLYKYSTPIFSMTWAIL